MPRIQAGFLYLGYFILLLVCVMPHGMRTPLVRWCDPAFVHEQPCTAGFITPAATNADIIRLFQTADPGSIANEARGFAERHDFAHITSWPDWPPAMVTLQTMLYAISPQMKVGLVLILLECALWAAVFCYTALLLREGLEDLAAIALPLLMLLTGEFTYYFHIGVFYSESISIAAFLLGAAVLLTAVAQKSLKRAFFAGMLFALSSYFRAQTELVMNLLLALALASLALCFFLRRENLRPLLKGGWIGCIVLALVAYQLCTFPCRVQHGMQLTNMTGSAMWPPTWTMKSEATPDVRFYIFGGGMEGCEADPDLCAEIHARHAAAGKEIFSTEDYFHFTIRSMSHHPLRWLALKLPYLKDFWMNAPQEAQPWESWMDVPQEPLLLLALLILLLARCVWVRDGWHLALGACLLATIAGIVIPPFIAHFEARYLYQCKIFILYAALLAMGRGDRNAYAYLK